MQEGSLPSKGVLFGGKKICLVLHVPSSGSMRSAYDQPTSKLCLDTNLLGLSVDSFTFFLIKCLDSIMVPGSNVGHFC